MKLGNCKIANLVHATYKDMSNSLMVAMQDYDTVLRITTRPVHVI